MTERPRDDEDDASLLQQMLEDASALARGEAPEKKTAAVSVPFLPQSRSDTNKVTPETLTADIDSLVSAQVNEILARPEVQRLRVAWLGLKELVDQVDVHKNVQVEFLSCSKKELADDFEGATSVTASGLYRRLCEKELLPAGEPYSPVSLIVTDYEFDHHQHDLELLTHCAAVAADAHAPFIANASPRFFGCERFSDLPTLGDIRSILETPRYAAWQSFRDSEDAPYVALCVPGVSRVFAVQVATSFAKCRGFEALTGEAPELADGLRATGQVERDLSDAGFITLIGGEGISPRFCSARSAHQPRRFADTAEGRAAAINSRAGAELASVLTISRLAHFVEAIATELLPGVTAGDLERALQHWLSHYATEVRGAVEASIVVTDARYLRYELTLRLRERDSGFSLEVAGRLD